MEKKKRKIGIIGGVGPMATVVFMKKIIEMTDAACDQDYIEILVDHCPSIPDRTAYILDHTKPNPVRKILECADRLADGGAYEIAIPCVTAHYFHQEIQKKSRREVLNGVRDTMDYLKDKGYSKIGVMATDGTVRSSLFVQNESDGMEIIYPSAERQKEVMHLIYDDVKSGREPEMGLFYRVTEELKDKGAEVIVLGCTELSVIADHRHPQGLYLDVLDVLARRLVMDCGRLKNQYRELLPLKGEKL